MLAQWIMQRFGSLWCAALVLLVASCAQLSPQKIAFTPVASGDATLAGSGKISLEVFDRRADSAIGTRGGAYSDTSLIESAEPLAPIIEAFVAEALQQGGFEVSAQLPDMALTIELTELSYAVADYRASIKRTRVKAALSVSLVKGNTTFNNTYVTEQSTDTVGYPGEKKNIELLNSVFAAVLNRLLSDTNLSRFVNKQ